MNSGFVGFPVCVGEFGGGFGRGEIGEYCGARVVPVKVRRLASGGKVLIGKGFVWERFCLGVARRRQWKGAPRLSRRLSCLRNVLIPYGKWALQRSSLKSNWRGNSTVLSDEVTVLFRNRAVRE